MYPRNNASPERIAVGQVVLIADGTIQTSAVVITVRGQGGAEATGGGTTAYGAEGTVYYTPTQAETNFTSFVVIASKASCFSASQTVVTTAADTAGQVALSAASVDLIWDESLAAHQTVLTAGRAMTLGGVPISETTATGTPSTTSIQLVAGSTVDNFYNDQTLKILSGSGVGQARVISGYTGSTKTATFDEAFTVAPSSGDAVAIEINHVHPVSEIQSGLATAANLALVKAKTDSLTFTKAGEVDSNVQSVNGVTITGDGSATPFDV